MKIRITKEFHFEMAHALWNYDGKCKNIHGHSYKLFVTVKGEPIEDINNPKNGMVMDFGDLKKIVNNHIIDKHDHAIAINKNTPHAKLFESEHSFDLIEYKDYQPTCEKMVEDFVEIIKKELPKNVELVSIKLYETATSFAEWLAEDN